MIKKKKNLKARTVYNPMYILKDVLVSIYIVGQIFILWDSKEEKDSLSWESSLLFLVMAFRDKWSNSHYFWRSWFYKQWKFQVSVTHVAMV